MKKIMFYLLLSVFFACINIYAQAIQIPFTVSDNAPSMNSRALVVGLDPSATDGIDLALGEGELPPMPPSGNFEARLFLPSFSGSLASYKDFRNGSRFFNGTVEYRLRYQKHSTASSITIAWNFPTSVTGVLKDVATNGIVINVAVSGTGSYTVANPNSFNQLKLFVTYSMVSGSVNLTAVPEGLYNRSADRLNTTDTFSVYLRQMSNPYSIVDSATITLDSLTFTGVAQFGASSGSYYVVLKGRNTLTTWSSAPIAFVTGSSVDYNFSSARNQAYGDNLKKIGTRWCMYSGDVNQDGIIDFSDMIAVDNDAFISATGILATDINGDQLVNNQDVLLLDANSLNMITVQKP